MIRQCVALVPISKATQATTTPPDLPRRPVLPPGLTRSAARSWPPACYQGSFSSLPCPSKGTPMKTGSRIPGFYDLPIEKRRLLLMESGSLDEEDLSRLAYGGLTVQAADGLVE